MAGLLRDRYFEYATNQAWDLVTGRVVPTDTHDDVDRAGRTPRSLIEVLEHGVDGSPRWIVSDTGAKDWHREAQTIASEARRHGYVPLAVNVFLRRRLLLANELRTRAMVLFADPDAPFEQVRTALLHAAAMSPRPHVLMSVLRTAAARPAAHWQAAEARAVYGSEPAAAATAVTPREVLRLIPNSSAPAAMPLPSDYYGTSPQRLCDGTLARAPLRFTFGWGDSSWNAGRRAQRRESLTKPRSTQKVRTSISLLRPGSGRQPPERTRVSFRQPSHCAGRRL